MFLHTRIDGRDGRECQVFQYENFAAAVKAIRAAFVHTTELRDHLLVSIPSSGHFMGEWETERFIAEAETQDYSELPEGAPTPDDPITVAYKHFFACE